MMVARTDVRLPLGVWYFSRETLHNSSAIKSQRNASLLFVIYDWLGSNRMVKYQ